MDELSTQELRGKAFAANLRRAFQAPGDSDLPPAFAVLLDRLGKVAPPSPPRPRDPHRLDS
jgi:hypothetical protein